MIKARFEDKLQAPGSNLELKEEKERDSESEIESQLIYWIIELKA